MASKSKSKQAREKQAARHAESAREKVEAPREQVRASIQRGMDTLARRAFPVFG